MTQPASPGAPPPTILVADDDDDNRVLIGRLLATRSYRVIEAKDGDEALLKGALPEVDLVLLDQMMPGLTGMQVLKKLRDQNHDVPIIMVTAVGDAAQIAKALHDGADDYVTKPFSPLVLLARVERRLRPRAAPVPVKEVPPAVTAHGTARMTHAEPEKGAFTSFFGRLMRGKRSSDAMMEERPPCFDTKMRRSLPTLSGGTCS